MLNTVRDLKLYKKEAEILGSTQNGGIFSIKILTSVSSQSPK